MASSLPRRPASPSPLPQGRDEVQRGDENAEEDPVADDVAHRHGLAADDRGDASKQDAARHRPDRPANEEVPVARKRPGVLSRSVRTAGGHAWLITPGQLGHASPAPVRPSKTPCVALGRNSMHPCPQGLLWPPSWPRSTARPPQAPRRDQQRWPRRSRALDTQRARCGTSTWLCLRTIRCSSRCSDRF